MSTTTLKIIALVLMTVDHVGEFFPGTPLALRYIGRLSASIFFFCAVEGFTHTRNKKIYLLRLYGLSVLMVILDHTLPLLFDSRQSILNNVFLEILVMMLLVFLCETYGNHQKRKIFLIVVLYFVYQIVMYQLTGKLLKYESCMEQCLVRSLLVCMDVSGDACYVGCLIPIFYLCKGNKKKMALFFSGWCVLYFCCNVLVLPYYLNAVFEPLGIEFAKPWTFLKRMFQGYFQWMMLFALPFLLCYNGKKGKGLKYLFYIYYPVHIAVFYTAGMLLEMTQQNT